MTVLTITTQEEARTYLHLLLDTKHLTKIDVMASVQLTAEQREAYKTLQARIRKQNSRKGKTEILLPLPRGTGEALSRVMQAAGFDDPRDFIAFQIHRLDDLLARDGHSFTNQTKRTVTVTGLEKYVDRLHAEGEATHETD